MSQAHAQASRTWVSGVGDDANPCSRTAPCKTFAGALPKTAPHGVIDVLDPGGFGAVTINKAITIDGGGMLASVLVSGTNGIVISAPADATVVLRNLDFTGLTTGASAVKIVSAKTVILDDVRIRDFQNGVEVVTGAKASVLVQRSSITTNSTAAIAMTDADSRVLLSNTSVFGNALAFKITAGKVSSYNNNRLEGNAGGTTPTEVVYER
ncbi:MAG: right-handed parallel beta-helix repeat-containing protein [Comamonas sp.]